MAGKWLQPFPEKDDRAILELQTTAKEPWLDVEIMSINRSIASIRPVDLKLGTRLDIQLRLAKDMACLLAPRFIGKHLRLQLHDEDPGVGCLRMDAPLGADLNSSPLIPDPYCLGTKGYEQFRNQLRISPLPAWRDRLPVVFWRGATTGSKNITPDNLNATLRYQLCCLASQTCTNRCALQSGRPGLNSKNNTAVRKLLLQRGLMSATVDPGVPSAFLFVDIDETLILGLLWKLLSAARTTCNELSPAVVSRANDSLETYGASGSRPQRLA